MTPERTAEILSAIVALLDAGGGPTEAKDVTVFDSWSVDDEIFIIYGAPWFDGKLGYRQHLTNWDETDLVEDLAHFTIGEPMGRIALVLDPPDIDGITWWDDSTAKRIEERLRIEPDPAVPGSGTRLWYANPEGPTD